MRWAGSLGISDFSLKSLMIPVCRMYEGYCGNEVFAVYQHDRPSLTSLTSLTHFFSYVIQYLDSGREKWNLYLCSFRTFDNEPHSRRVRDPKKWFSAVSCSNLALRILKLRREDFKQTGSSTFKIGWELSSPQSIVSAYCMGSKWSVEFHRDAPYFHFIASWG